MTILTTNIIALIAYLIASVHLIVAFKRQLLPSKSLLLLMGVFLLAVHGAAIVTSSIQSQGLLLNVFNTSSLIFWVMNLLVLISSLKKPLHNLFIVLFPLSALSILAALTGYYIGEHLILDSHLATHVILSILAYSFLTIASLQALFLAYQNHLLKSKQHLTQARFLPPLQTMESLLFELVWAGEILLTLAIASGFWFLEDMFAQHQVHKTVLGIAAWYIYAGLLWGRHFRGWRGIKATRWTLAGFISLMLAYFGSKIVLEIILHRV